MYPERPTMLKQLCQITLLLLAPSAIAQTDAPPAYPQAEYQMQLPPPVTNLGFPTIVGSRELSNYMQGGIGLRGGYINNLYPGSGAGTVDEATFGVEPTISIDRTTDRIHETLRYAPTFIFYAPDGNLNTINHSAGVAFQYRVTPYVTFLAGDTLAKTSNTWSQPLTSGSISGSLPPTSPGFIAPFAPQISNSAYAQLAWQFSRNAMIGFGGNTNLLDYYKPSQALGLFNSNARAGAAFYTQRFGSRQYIGGLYQYSLILATPTDAVGPASTNLEEQNFLGFYTLYLQPTLSLSFGAGAQHYNLDQSTVSPLQSWAPIAVASIGWQAPRIAFALTYNHTVTEGEGVVGAYLSDAANLSTQLQLSPYWITTVSGSYSQLTPVSTSILNSTPGGHTISFAGEIGRQLGEHFTLALQYQYLHQNYRGIPSLAANPDSSRETASITYHFSRLLGR